MATHVINLPDEQEQFVQARFASGEFASMDEVFQSVVQNVQMAEFLKNNRDKINDLLQEAIDCGEFYDVTPEYWQRKREQLLGEGAERAKAS